MKARQQAQRAEGERSQTRRIAIVGGGVAGVVTAFALTDPERVAEHGPVEVTLFQKGWRLGGKGASGRNAEIGQRIEEHGLHLWMGFYENAFAQMERCLEEIRPLRPENYRIRTIEESFAKANYIGVMEHPFGRDWQLWDADFPDDGKLPWKDRASTNTWVYLWRGLVLLGALLRSARDPIARGAEVDFVDPGERPEFLPPEIPGPGELLLELRGWVESALLLAAEVADQGVDAAASFVQLFAERLPFLPLLGNAFEALSEQINRYVGRMAGDAEDDDLRRTFEMIELVTTCLRGIAVEGLFTAESFDRIDRYDLREWLALHGGSERARNSAVLRGLYDLTFSYEDGRGDRPRFAAGTALRNICRMFFTYHGALFWRMQGGMGDVVFEPFYQALRARGVRFRFFHELTDIELDDERDALRELVLQQQVELVDARGAETLDYDPLVAIDFADGTTLSCWPSAPRYAQLRGGIDVNGRFDFESHWEHHCYRERRFTIGPDGDFDTAVLAIGIGALPYVCPSLLERSERWRAMCAHVGTCETQACQLWLAPTLLELGWPHPPDIALTAYAEPLSTWADMTHLLPLERWPAPPATGPRCLAYFCHVLPDRDPPPQPDERTYPETRLASVEREMEAFFARDIARLWPFATHRYPDGFRRDLLWDGRAPDEGRPGEQAPRRAQRAEGERSESLLASQWVKVNVNPSDRYAQALPGGTRHRLRPGASGFEGLVLAGDWTLNGLNTGCVESAVLSALLASQAICAYPTDREIRARFQP
jgi:uncharacterized protein with NAD-binding domain and iron-sulfur cluster